MIKKSIFQIIKENKVMFAKAKNHTYSIPLDNVALSIQNLNVFFKQGFFRHKQVLNNISFEVKKGEFHGFIGNNGAGKTTTIRSILGFYPNAIGKIYINGIDSKSSKSKIKIGYVPEVAIFPKTLSAREYLHTFGLMSGIKKKNLDKRINEIIEKYNFNLPELNKSPEFMSSGQKKTILLIQALINDPELIIMDEPAANLDPSSRVVLYKTLKQLHNEGKTIFISSHILDELEKYIDSFTLLSQGNILYSGSMHNAVDEKFNTQIILSSYDEITLFLTVNNIEYEIKNNTLFVQLDKNQKKELLARLNKLNIEIFLLKENKDSILNKWFEGNKEL
ncbi:ABC transporter ATP-binding protein [Metamycoplasma auris]|uniref:ABC-2 type transport system ATP-binding protein n=1 Tax=Metamycoplasma auris TaxID=51363 RepID=A0A2W7GUX4_9BACT|nr:ABC transporter ATP-binding protein [Metamycoplasma auris]PZW01493.1 ABC-2 type transport system ATP-binding protein [Metamycoplasma auris]